MSEKLGKCSTCANLKIKENGACCFIYYCKNKIIFMGTAEEAGETLRRNAYKECGYLKK